MIPWRTLGRFPSGRGGTGNLMSRTRMNFIDGQATRAVKNCQALPWTLDHFMLRPRAWAQLWPLSSSARPAREKSMYTRETIWETCKSPRFSPVFHDYSGTRTCLGVSGLFNPPLETCIICGCCPWRFSQSNHSTCPSLSSRDFGIISWAWAEPSTGFAVSGLPD